jgi:hypothetical protein
MDVTAEGTIAARLERARARRFVGRSAESALLRDALRAAEPGFAVLYVHGPGGVGKTALLGELARVARDAGAVPVRVDGRATGPSPEAFAASAQPAGQGRTVLFIDTYEAILPLDGWIRETLIPGLPADALVVIAGRTPPPPGWAVNPGSASSAWTTWTPTGSGPSPPPPGRRRTSTSTSPPSPTATRWR